jgi:hypothetical protein
MWIRALWLVLITGCMDFDTIDIPSGVDFSDLTAADKPTTGAPGPGCTTCDAYLARGRAYGLMITLRNVMVIAPNPDTSVPGAPTHSQSTSNLPLEVNSSSSTAFFVSDVNTSDTYSATDAAAAMSDQVSVSGPGFLLYATLLRAVATSTVSHGSAGASSAGSKIQDVRINGQEYQNLDTPRTIAVRGDHGTPVGEVRVLETIYDTRTPGAASCQVNALHIILYGRDGTSEIYLAHAESTATTADRLPP